MSDNDGVFDDARVLGDIARVLECDPQSLSLDMIPADAGVDSLRLMTLIEEWRAEGLELDYYDMFSIQTLGEWVDYVKHAAQERA